MQTSTSKKTIRYLACKAVEPILNDSEKSPSLDNQIAKYTPKIIKPEDQSLFKRFCYDLCRWHLKLTALSQLLLDKPLKKKDFDLQLALNIGLLQLLILEMPPHAAIKESVDIAKMVRKPWAAGLINAVLRKAQRRERLNLEKEIAEHLYSLSSHPAWLVDILRRDWPNHYREILSANNIPGPLTLRLNLSRFSRPYYLELLKHQAMHAHPTPLSPYGITLEKHCCVDNIPHFNDGTVSVQDEAAQLAGHILDIQNHHTVLDACAAPGGKSAHLFELAPNATLLVNDISSSRLQRVVDNFIRLGISTQISNQDLRAMQEYSEHFDRILLDAPCSGTGVIRRHPDIKWLRRESDIQQLSAQQYTLLEHAWQLLKPGGRILYCTCSVLHQENEAVIARFTNTTKSAKQLPITLEGGISTQNGQYLLPSESGHDGFYFSLLEKSVELKC